MSEEKMRADFEKWYLSVVKGHPNNLLRDADGGYKYLGSMYLAWEAATLIERQAALQESEAGAVAWLHEMVEPDGNKTGMFSFKPDNPWSHWMESHKEKCQYTKTPLFLAPPSAQAIETAAIMKCAEVLREQSHPCDCDTLTDIVIHKTLDIAAGQLLALIPQDGRTQLVALLENAVEAGQDSIYTGDVGCGETALLSDRTISSIVTNLIGEKK